MSENNESGGERGVLKDGDKDTEELEGLVSGGR
ncbi:hypothetical protein A2U01_0062020, partial [Trifolium medium]|nr:hypothetical protein [Trifolium medium]